MNAQPGPENHKKVVVVGGGRAGEAVLDLLSRDERYAPFVCEIDYDRLQDLRASGVAGDQISGTDRRQMETVLRDAACVICAAPPSVAPNVAASAMAAGCHYVDMIETVQPVADLVRSVRGEQGFAPGCGLAPGFVSALVDQMIRESQANADITAYVGVLPAEKTNRLGYGNMWGIDGLMAEYTGPCRALESGAVVTRPALEALERIEIGGQVLEAFTTSGSLEDLVDHYRGKVHGLTFKTLRYPGHLDHVRFLLDDLKLSERLYMFRNLLLNGLPQVDRDRVIIHVANRAPGASRPVTRIFDATPSGNGVSRSAVAYVTALHVCAVADILVQRLAPHGGLLHHHDLTLELLGQSRYGRALHLQD